MSKRLRHVIGTVTEFRFRIQDVSFDRVKTAKDLTGWETWFEIEDVDGTQLLSLTTGAGITHTDEPNGEIVARIEWNETFLGIFGDGKKYAVLARLPSGGDIERDEAIRGLIDLVPQIVDNPP